MAVSELTINDAEQTGEDQFKGQKIPLQPETVSKGWNTVNLKYLTPYNKNKTGLHTYTDGQDDK